MKSVQTIATDPRFDHILEFVVRLVRGELQARLVPPETNDDLAGVIAGLNMLAEELSASVDSLKDADAKFQILVGQSIVGAYIYQDGRIVYCNPAMAKILGYTQEELLELPDPLETIPVPGDRALAEENVRLRLNGEVPSVRYELRIRRKDGEIRHVETHGTAADYRGKPAILGVTVDINDRKRSEARQQRLVSVLEETTDLVGFARPDGTVMNVNRAGRSMIGISPDEDATKLKIWEVHPPWTNQILRDVAMPAAERNGVWKGEAAFLARDGEEIPVSMVLLAHKSQEGKLEFFSTISRDLRERNALEDVLRSWARRLLEVQEAERRAVSLTLHDEIGQQLTGVSMKLESTRGATREHVDLRIGEALRQLKDLMVTVGALSASLVPSILLDLGLLSALNSLILQHRQNGAMDIDLQHSGLDRRFLPEIETAAYRIVQESLTNVIRHASAK